MMADMLPQSDDEHLPPLMDDPEDPDMVIVDVGDDPEDDAEDPEIEHFDNIIDDFDEDHLSIVGMDLIASYRDDKESRATWERDYKKGLESITPQENEADDSRTNKKLTQVIHPVMAEAATQFQARAIGELFPPEGPVGTVVIGETTEQFQEQASRVSTYMNYQLTEEMEEYFPDLDQMLFHLPLTGHTFKKAFYDPTVARVVSRFVQAEHFVINNSATNLSSATRYTHIINMSRQSYNELVQEGYYKPLPSQSGYDDFEDISKEQDGIDSNVLTDDEDVTLLEVHTYLDIEHEVDEEANEPKWPYIVTIHEASNTVVSVRRNWDEDDPKHKKLVWFVSYKFLPGLGFYGYGLFHVIGGLSKAATGALRALLDAAAYSNMQGGFKLRGRVRGGSLDIRPGEFVDLDAAVDDINKAIMPLPFKEPSQTMFQLLTYIVDTAKQYANSTETKISDANQNTPVGTTVALLEENARVFSAIHKRCHYSQKQEFKLIAKLNGIYLDEEYPFTVKGNNQFIRRRDFDNRVDVVPVSDPAIFSSTQRIAQAQGMLQMAQTYPQFHNQYKAIKRMYEAMRVPNYEEVLFDPTQAERMDPVAENIAIMHNRPVKAFIDQNHEAHIAVLDEWFGRLPKQAQPIYAQAYISHRAEHMAMLYRVQMQAQLGAPLPPLPDFRDQSAEIVPIDAITDAKISAAAAAVVNQAKLQPLGPEPPSGEGDPASDPMAQARLMMQVEMESTKAKAQADVEARHMKAQADAQIAQARAQLDMQLDSIKAQRRAEEDRARSERKSQADQVKLDNELKAIRARAENDIALAQQKMKNDLLQSRAEWNIEQQQQQREFEQDLQMERAKANAKQASDTNGN